MVLFLNKERNIAIAISEEGSNSIYIMEWEVIHLLSIRKSTAWLYLLFFFFSYFVDIMN